MGVYGGTNHATFLKRPKIVNGRGSLVVSGMETSLANVGGSHTFENPASLKQGFVGQVIEINFKNLNMCLTLGILVSKLVPLFFW